MTDGAVRLEISGPLARIVLDRPRKRNALSTHLIAELGDRLEDVAVSEPDDGSIATVAAIAVGGAAVMAIAGVFIARRRRDP